MILKNLWTKYVNSVPLMMILQALNMTGDVNKRQQKASNSNLLL
jgi:hypothetical protein